MSTIEQIQRAIDMLEVSPTVFAERVGVSQGLVSHWLSGLKKPGWQSCQKIERATNKRIRCVELRPDIFETNNKVA